MSSVRRAPARANQGAGTTGEREVLPHTRLVAWQWEATTIPIPESEWGRLAERISDALSEVHRTTVLPGVEITLGDSASSILRINHGGPEEAFLLEVRRTGLLYRHQPVTGARMGGDGPGRHIRVVAKPLLARAVLDPQIRERLLSAACGYELEAIVPGDEAHANSQLALAKLVHGLQSRPWEQHLPDQPRATLASSARSAVRGRPGAAAKRSAPSVDARSAGRRRAACSGRGRPPAGSAAARPRPCPRCPARRCSPGAFCPT